MVSGDEAQVLKSMDFPSPLPLLPGTLLSEVVVYVSILCIYQMADNGTTLYI